MATYVITTAVIKNGDKFLIAKRADSKRFSPGQWEFISGFMDRKGSAEEIILEEIKEELNAEGRIITSSPAFEIQDDEGTWVAIPFLIELSNNEVQSNPAEHSEVKWVTKNELDNYDELGPFLDNSGFYGLLQ